MTNLSVAAGDIINGAIVRDVVGANPEVEAEARHLREVALNMAEDVPQFARWAMSRTVVKRLLVAELGQLHPVELEEIVIRLAQAVAAKDPTRYDARFSEATQKLADTFRS